MILLFDDILYYESMSSFIYAAIPSIPRADDDSLFYVISRA